MTTKNTLLSMIGLSSFLDLEYLSETFSTMTPEQNEGCPTEQLFTEKGETLFENGSQLTYEKLIKN